MVKSKKKAGARTLSSTRALIGKLKVSRIQGALSSLFHYTNISAFAKMVDVRKQVPPSSLLIEKSFQLFRLRFIGLTNELDERGC